MPWYLDLPWWVWPTFMAATTLGALRYGTRCERLASLVLVVGATASYLAIRHKYHQTEWVLAAVDVGVLAGLTAIAMTSPRYWPIGAAAAHLLNVVVHLADAFDPAVRPWAYATAQVIFSFTATGVLAAGVWTRYRERRRTPASAVSIQPAEAPRWRDAA